jgi:hypothetical protein
MNKNTRQRRAIARRNFHVNHEASTEFDVPVMRPGGYTLTKTSVRIGFVQPPPNKRRQRTQASVIDTAANAANAEVAALAAAADALLGKPKAEQPLKERPAPRPARPVKPLGKISI